MRCAGVASAKIVVSSISDTFLRNTSNKTLLTAVKTINRDALFIATADDVQSMQELEELGAFACISPQVEASPAYFTAMEKALHRY